MPIILCRCRPPRRRLSRRSIKNMAPPGSVVPPPPPPPLVMHVVEVAHTASANAAEWRFDRDIADPTGTLSTLTVKGASPLAFSRTGPRSLQLVYPLAVAGGTWANPGHETGIVSVEGYRLAAGTGTVA